MCGQFNLYVEPRARLHWRSRFCRSNRGPSTPSSSDRRNKCCTWSCWGGLYHLSARRRRLDASWYLYSRTFVEAGLMPHFIITTADDNEATAGVLLTDQPMPVPNMKRVSSVHQALVRQRYENNNYQGTSTSCVESTARGLYVDKVKNDARM